MGISGLLPLLKDIQVTRPLSDFSGQTLAVDAYVWLHKGTYGCASELVTGKRTLKYVEYAMHRVRLLQHFGIQPYIVFDGGPLPAKKETESERRKRRDENLARANALAAQGKHNQARDYYVKCVDVTPQMAYQFIKALRAESVPYVVAPYEADAQMAYLERVGLVDGIITEDSDLLVFGCKKVLFKLDAVANTIMCISRADFGSVSTGGISLLGWSDVEFRGMTILSGCDYLPSIPGVGLKTAHSLLRKHKTVENVIRALCLEGKKKVPSGYLDAFRLAEKVFLHQRVYDPTQEKLVHLLDLSAGKQWDAQTEVYVGMDLPPNLAKQIAEGDVCPVSLSPMVDINPTFVPRALKVISTNLPTANKSDKERSKMRCKPPEKPLPGILGFFTPQSKGAGMSSKARPQSAEQPARMDVPIATKEFPSVGRTSGKRTLVEVMDQDIAAKRKKRGEAHCGREYGDGIAATSKFFCVASSSPPRNTLVHDQDCDEEHPIAGLSRFAHRQSNKENDSCAGGGDITMHEVISLVAQEDGYITPSPSMCRGWDTPELSSPIRRGKAAADPNEMNNDRADGFDADVLSSPPVRRRLPGLLSRVRATTGGLDAGSVNIDKAGGGRELSQVNDRPSQTTNADEDQPPGCEGVGTLGPDLRATLGEWDWDEVTSEIECPDDASEESACSTSPSPGPVTPEDSGECGMGAGAGAPAAAVICNEDTMVDAGALELEAGSDVHLAEVRNAKVARGWWERWGRRGGTGTATPAGNWMRTPLKRRETTMTPDGRQQPLQSRLHSAQANVTDGLKRKGHPVDLRSAARRRSLAFTEEVKTAHRAGASRSSARSGSTGSEKLDEIGVAARNRIAEYRWMGG